MSASMLGTPRVRSSLTSVEMVMSFQFPALVERFEQKLGMTCEAAALLFEDTKRFLYLCSVSLDSIAPTPEIDKGWHEFILFTKEYAEFCRRHFGRFIHHRPRRSDDPPSDGMSGRRAVRLAREVFGTLSTNWGSINASDDCSPDTGGKGDDCAPEPSCSDEPDPS